MWDASEQKNDDMLRAGTNFLGGISRHREGVCGAVSALSIFLGFHYPHRIDDDKSKTRTREKSHELVQAFKDEFGSIVCQRFCTIRY